MPAMTNINLLSGLLMIEPIIKIVTNEMNPVRDWHAITPIPAAIKKRLSRILESFLGKNKIKKIKKV